MILEKAIEILEEEIGGMIKAGGGDWDDAILLGIEALKYYQKTRPEEVSSFCPRLPGETEE